MNDGHYEQENDSQQSDGFQTPKRCRRGVGPPDVPFGLDRRDFYALQDTPGNACPPALIAASDVCHGSDSGMDAPEDTDVMEEEWTEEDDSALVQVVLDKMRLSRREWDECAKVLGVERASLGQRWKHLVGEGRVGLKFGKGGRSRTARADVRKLWEAS